MQMDPRMKKSYLSEADVKVLESMRWVGVFAKAEHVA